jgi:hypothetical protein
MNEKKRRFAGLALIMSGAIAVVALMTPVEPLVAGEVSVTAIFKPSALNPSNTEFENTTPPGRYCTWRPDQCLNGDVYFFDVPVNLTKIYTKGTDPRKDFYIAFPPVRSVLLTHIDSGRTFPIVVSFNAISGELTPGAGAPVATIYVQGGCSYVYTAGNSDFVRFGWKVKNPLAPSPCWSGDDHEDVGFTQAYFAPWIGIGLEIHATSPLSLLNGEYEGHVTYTVGEAGADLDFGDDVTADSQLTMNFRFTVAHEFQVTFPSAAPRVTLAPIGGWQQWTDHGKAPVRLQQELPFTLTSSSDFSVKMRCEHDSGGRCGIEDLAAGTIVPVDVDVTLPGMSELSTGARAVEFPLVAQQAGAAPRFRPDSYMVNRPSKLRFSVNGNAVTQMLKAPGSRWQGDVTIVFDSNP